METYTTLKKLIKNDSFQSQRQKTLATLNDDMIDSPIIDIVNEINCLEYCFTLQSCFGHFLYSDQTDSNNMEPLPQTNIPGKIEYKIAYVALCIENNLLGRILMERLDNGAAQHHYRKQKLPIHVLYLIINSGTCLIFTLLRNKLTSFGCK